MDGNYCCMNCISVTRNITAKGFIYQTWHARALKHARSCATCKLTYKTSVWCSSMIYRMKPWVLSVSLYKFIKLQVCYHFIFNRVEARSIVLERESLVQIILTSNVREILKIVKVLVREGVCVWGGGVFLVTFHCWIHYFHFHLLHSPKKWGWEQLHDISIFYM